MLDKLEAQVYYNYANHVMDNVTLRSPGSGGMGGHGGHGGMSMGGHGGHMMSSGMTMQLDRRTVGGRVIGTGSGRT